MKQINLSAIDLNLLVALDALLDEGSVTRAARRCGVGQSAMSHSLRRLRRLFDDPLLVRDGRQMAPTPRALELIGPLGQTLDAVRRLLTLEPDFDPATSRRRFRLVAPDLVAAALPELMRVLQAEAPGVAIDVRLPDASVADAVRAGGDDLGAGTPPENGASLMQRRVGHVGWTVLMRAEHPAASGAFTLERWLAYPHVVVRTGSLSRSIVGAAVEARGLSRTIGLVVPGFMIVPRIVARTDHLFLAPSLLDTDLVGGGALVARPPPIALPPMPVVLVWPERYHADPGHRWFRSRVAAVLSERLLRST